MHMVQGPIQADPSQVHLVSNFVGDQLTKISGRNFRLLFSAQQLLLWTLTRENPEGPVSSGSISSASGPVSTYCSSLYWQTLSLHHLARSWRQN